jgi:stage IV sporulation protein FB
MGVSIGRLFGTDIRATGGFFLLIGLYFFMFGAERAAEAGIFCFAVVLSLLVHEFGHVFGVRRQLNSESVVILWGMGGLCVHERTDEPRKRLIIALMGPAFSALLGVLVVPLYLWVPMPHPALETLVWAMVWINVIWLGINLVPLLPLDGGVALESALAMRIGQSRAQTITRRVSIVAAGGLVLFGYLMQLPFVTVLGVLALMQNVQQR